MTLSRIKYVAVVVGLLAMFASLPVAEVNSVTGGIAGINNTLTGGDGTGDATITLTIDDLSLVKQARNLAGTVLPGGTDVLRTQEIYFVLFVDNPTGFPAVDARITDALDEGQFTYVPNSLEQTVVASGADDAAIWAGTWTALSDDVNGADDEASIIDSGAPVGRDNLTVGAVVGQVNQPLDVAGPSLWAIRFRVTVN